MTDTLVYAVTAKGTRHLLQISGWGPEEVVGSFSWEGEYPALIVSVDVHLPGRIHNELLSQPKNLHYGDRIVITFLAFPHHKMLHLLQVATQ